VFAIAFACSIMQDSSSWESRIPGSPARTMAEIAERVRSVVSRNRGIPIDAVTMDLTVEDMHMDSLETANLLFALEDEFDFSIPDDEIKSMRSVRDMVAAVERRPTRKPEDTRVSD
jgi:acyl carrier protein